MIIIVMFDLPVLSDEDKKKYNEFRRFLLKDGYNMLQFSIYSRLCPNFDATYVYLDRLQKAAPTNGSVRVMVVTNKQFTEAKVLTGRKSYQEKRINKNQLVLF